MPCAGSISSHGPRPRSPRMWRGPAWFGRLRLLADGSRVGGKPRRHKTSRAVDEAAVGTAVIEDTRPAHPIAALSDDRVAARDLGILDADVGAQPAPEMDDGAVEGDEVDLLPMLDRQVAAGRRRRERDRATAGAVVEHLEGVDDER